jgi:prepilin-type N-terminal cleavage/methylation domain-containing protein
MRTSIASRRRGFTLIELLAVILLLGLGLGVGLTLDFAGSPQQPKQQTLLLANELELAAQEAVLDGVVLGLDFFTDGTQTTAYRWLRLREQAWDSYALQDDDAADTVFPEGLTLALELGGQAVTLEQRVELPSDAPFFPEILLLPTRELTEFTLSIAGTADAASVLTADLMGRIRVDADAPPPP